MNQEKAFTSLHQKLTAFHPLSQKSWEAIKENLYTKNVRENEFFAREGGQVQELAFIVSGIVRMFFVDEEGNEWIKLFVLKDDFLQANINPYEKGYNVQALKDTELLCVRYTKLIQLMEVHKDIQSLSQKLTMYYVSKKQQREVDLLSKKGSERYKDFCLEYPTLENEIAHYHIASYLGMTPTQLSRIRKECKALTNVNDK